MKLQLHRLGFGSGGPIPSRLRFRPEKKVGADDPRAGLRVQISDAPVDRESPPWQLSLMSQDDATLCIDIGGSGLKVMVVSGLGEPVTERVRAETPRPATPAAVLRELKKLMAQVDASYSRV